MTDFQQVRRPRARKMHRCVECTTLIQVGEVYVRVHGKSDGELYTQRYCTSCDALWALARRDGLIRVDDDEVAAGDLFEFVRDDLCEFSEDGTVNGVKARYATLFTLDDTRPSCQPLRVTKVLA